METTQPTANELRSAIMGEIVTQYPFMVPDWESLARVFLGLIPYDDLLELREMVGTRK